MRLFRLVVLKDRTAQHITCVDPWRNTSEITFSAVMRMRKWLLAVHAGFWMQEPDFYCDVVFWICAKTGEIHRIAWAVRWTAKILEWNRRTTFNVLMTSHLLYVTKGHYSLKTTHTNVTRLLFFTEIFVWKTTAGHRVCQDYDISVSWFVCRKGELKYF
jgi:hypothetical protein